MALFVLDETVQHVDPLLSAFLYYRSPDGVVEVIGMPTGTSLDGTCMVTTVPAERFDDLLEEAGALPLDEALTRHWPPAASPSTSGRRATSSPTSKPVWRRSSRPGAWSARRRRAVSPIPRRSPDSPTSTP